jgi:hypothetical protein
MKTPLGYECIVIDLDKKIIPLQTRSVVEAAGDKKTVLKDGFLLILLWQNFPQLARELGPVLSTLSGHLVKRGGRRRGIEGTVLLYPE